MFGGDSSEDTKSDNESDYEDEPGYEAASESSDGNGDDNESSDGNGYDNEGGDGNGDDNESSKGNGDDDDGRDSRDDDTAMVSIAEATKLRGRNSGISIREPEPEPTEYSSILVGPSNKRKRDTVRLPAKRFKDSIVASASSSAANNASAAVAVDPVGISSQSLVNVHAETITNTSSESWNIPVGIPTRRAQSQAGDLVTDAITRSNLQGPIFGASSSSSIEAQVDEIMASLTRMAPHANAMQRLYGLREQPPLLQIPPYTPFGIPMRSPFPNAVPGLHSQAQIKDATRWCLSLFPSPWRDTSLVPSFQGNITRPSGVNALRPNSVSRSIPSTTMSDILGSSSSSSVQAQANAIRPPAFGLLPAAIPNYQQQQLRPSSSAMGLPQHLRQQPPLLQDVRGLDLNLPANNEDADEEEDEGLDLNLPARDE